MANQWRGIALALLAGLALAVSCSDEQRSPIPGGAFGDPCTSGASCDAKACVPHMGTTVCSVACDSHHPCPNDWSCWTPLDAEQTTDGAPRSYCVSPFWSLCRPCDADVDCAMVAAGGTAACVDYDQQGAFCGTACESSTDCPEGYMCNDVTTVGGRTTKACVHVSGFCPCTPYLASLKAPTHCHRDNAFGVCAGERTCDGKTWSPCTAQEPAAEIPNLIDDDCDGLTDEDACFCGDSRCDPGCGETLATCPCDCAVDGDGICSPCGENPAKNHDDCCRTKNGMGCGDGICLGFGCGENPSTCPEDCSTPCGNGICEPGENPSTCAEDCKHQVCGNHVCEPTDGGPEGCPGDCLPTCGDCICDPTRDESVHNCPIDCGYCGDGVCSPCGLLGETRKTCAADCCVPSAEICNAVDDDCDGQIDEEGAGLCVSFYRDDDHDGLGDAATARCLCGPTDAYPTRVAGDCDDHRAEIGSGPPESCNGLDDDCDGETDEDFALGESCEAPSGPCWTGAIACDGPDRTTCEDGEVLPAGTLCAPVVCADGVVRPAATCDDAGGCLTMPWSTCHGYACEPSGKCKSACATNEDCGTGFACGAEHTCVQVAASCTRDAECIDQDWHTLDLCLGVCVHPPRDDASGDGDEDGDGVVNASDVCPETADPAQKDSDHDGHGDACDGCDGPGGAFVLGAACVDPHDGCRLGALACGVDGKPSCVGDHAAPVGFGCGETQCEGDALRLTGTCQADGSCALGALVSCSGYHCAETPTGPDSCLTACESDAQCTSDYTCVRTPSGGRCAPKKATGEACGTDRDCSLGHCVNGVCCESACSEACFTCNSAGNAGKCVAVPDQTDPDNDCGACSTCDALRGCVAAEVDTDPKSACPRDGGCGMTGSCDGLGHCAFAPALTSCGPARCADGAILTGGTCDGQGGCDDATTEACAGHTACASDGSTCLPNCKSDRQCASGYFCNLVQGTEGTCVAQQANARGCSGASECLSGHCVDGICCESDCSAPCMTCARAGSEGKCVLATANTDPSNRCGLCRVCDGNGSCQDAPNASDPLGECTPSNTACGATGQCDGHGACAYASATKTCGETRCIGQVLFAAPTCDGKGQCPAPGGKQCDGAFLCDEATNTCRTECTSDAQCQTGYFCDAVGSNGVVHVPTGHCIQRTPPGTSCTRGFTCDTGYCTDGVCCSSACGETCRSCALADHRGTCTPIASGADDACAGMFTCSNGHCGQVAGTACVGSDACASGVCSAGTCCPTACDGLCQSCAGGTCADLRLAQNPGRCSGQNWCDATGTCSPIRESTCAIASDCPAGWACLDGHCAQPAQLGTACTADGDCASSHCSDGVCCDSACGDVCQACNAYGHCAPVAAGSTDAACPLGEVCANGGGCGTPNGQGCPAGGRCASGFCSDADGVCCASSCGGLCQTCASGTCQTVADGYGDDTCGSGQVCIRGGCTTLADTCKDNSECATGACYRINPDVGVCCDAACADPCETCLDPIGTCTPVAEAENPGHCAGESWCDPTATCVPKAGQPCSVDYRCADGYYCGPDLKCVAASVTGSACSGNDGCASGFCVDGVCCESACAGPCRDCATAGHPGECLIAATGSDPAADCPAGQTCSREAQGCALADGQSCHLASDCASGDCVDGVCCATACDAPCQTCAAPGTLGTCTSVQGSDDRTECQGPLTCDAQGSCLLDAGMPCAQSAECASGACETGVCCPSGCSGDCQACMPDGSCFDVTADVNPGRCDDGKRCNVSGACVDVRADGAGCSGDDDCRSGHCVDGFCCASACDGACEACNIPGRVGSCEAAEPGTDPHHSCLPGNACNALGLCAADYGSTCTSPSECASGFCRDNVCCTTICNGTCQACNNDGARGFCTTVIGRSDADSCPSPWQCGNDGNCQLGLGQPCAGASQCASGHCENAAGASGLDFNVCCQESCASDCQNCAAGTGACGPLRRVEDGVRCSDLAWCDADGQCRAKAAARCKGSDADCPSGYYCDPAFSGSDGTSACMPRLANGKNCSANGQCQSSNCRGDRCCDASCAAPFVCDESGECGLPPGLPCNLAGACVTNLCVDGVCCQSTCDGVCTACNVSGLEGRCSAVTGTDPSCPGYCTAGVCGPGPACDAQHPCVGGGFCNHGMCVAAGLGPGQACLDNAQCASGFCADHVCCDSPCADVCYTCDGTGSGFAGACSPLTGPDPACNGSCTNGQCLGAQGAACNSNGNCASGSCVGGFCAGMVQGSDVSP